MTTLISTSLHLIANAVGKRKAVALTLNDSSDLRELLVAAYNSDISYGVRCSRPTSYNACHPLSASERQLLWDLEHRNLTGSTAEALVAEAVKHNESLAFILARSFDLGLTKTTINKVFPNLIPDFKVQLAKSVPLSKVKFPCYAETKYDGVRLITTVTDGRVVFKTRNGKEVALPKLAYLFDWSAAGNFDGELITGAGGTADRTTVSGMVTSAMKGGVIDESGLTYVLFDMPRVQAPYLARRSRLTNAVLSCNEYEGAGSPRVILADTCEMHDSRGASVLFHAKLAEGSEGLILKQPQHYYTGTRSAAWVKLKAIETADLQVVGVTEGQGKYQGMVGALECVGFVGGCAVAVNVSGLSDGARLLDNWVGKTVEVAYNTVSRDKTTGQHSLFLPRFVCVRDDK